LFRNEWYLSASVVSRFGLGANRLLGDKTERLFVWDATIFFSEQLDDGNGFAPR
jgi:hypothetical protein